MTRTVLADRLDLLAEIESIDAALDAVEQRHGGSTPDVDDARQRVRRARVIALAQLHALAGAQTVH